MDATGLIKTEEQIAQEQQAAQQEQMMQQGQQGLMNAAEAQLSK